MAPPRQPIPHLADLDLVIETARLRLRPLREADADDLFPLAADPELVPHVTWTAHADRSETLAYITARSADPNSLVWAIEHEGRAVGCIGLHSIMWQLRACRTDRGELGYWIGRPYWGKGLVTEAVEALVRYAFDTIGLHKITVHCFAENDGSRRVLEKTGFRFVGRAEDDIWRDGRWHANLLYELTAPEWPDVHTTMKIPRPVQ
jgi:RimJ/RimL family protein N-acetyltransferase